MRALWLVKEVGVKMTHCSNVPTTPLRQWGFRQCLPFSWTTLGGKHCRHPIAVMGVVDTFRHCFLCIQNSLMTFFVNPVDSFTRVWLTKFYSPNKQQMQREVGLKEPSSNVLFPLWRAFTLASLEWLTLFVNPVDNFTKFCVDKILLSQ